MLVLSVVPLETKRLTSHPTPATQHQIVIFSLFKKAGLSPRLHGLGMRLEQLPSQDNWLARSSSRTRVGHLTRPIPSRRLGNPSPMSNKSIAFIQRREREGLVEERVVKLALHGARVDKQESGNAANLLLRCTEVSWGRNWCRTFHPDTEDTSGHKRTQENTITLTL